MHAHIIYSLIPANWFNAKKTHHKTDNLLPKTANKSKQTSHIQPLIAPPLQPRLLDPFIQNNCTSTLLHENNLATQKHAIQMAATSMRKYLNDTHPDTTSWLIQQITHVHIAGEGTTTNWLSF